MGQTTKHEIVSSQYLIFHILFLLVHSNIKSDADKECLSLSKR